MLYESDRRTFRLTRDPDSRLFKVDRGVAIGRLILKRLAGQGGAEDFPTALEAEIAEIRAERSRKAGAQVLVIFEAQGDVEVALQEPLQENESFIVTFDALDKKSLILKHRAEVEAMMLALAMETDASPRFATVSEDIYFINEEGKDVYSISFSASAEGVVASCLTQDGVDRISL